MYLSKSLINSYLWCPLQCKLQFIDRIKVPLNDALIRGIAVHKAVELYYDNINTDSMYGNPAKEINRAMFLSKQAQQYRYYMIGFYNYEIIRANKCLKCEKELKTYFIPKYRELYIKSKELELSGYIDLVPKLFNDNYGIFDLKSGDPKKGAPKELPEYLKEEMMFYNILFESSHKEEIDLLGIIYTHIKDSFRKVDITDELKNTVLGIIDIVRNSIEMEIFPRTDIPSHCANCDYKLHGKCPIPY